MDIIMFFNANSTYIILRLILITILGLGLIGWIIWAVGSRQHKLLIILPITVIIHAMIFVTAGAISRLSPHVDFSGFINNWSQILRIHEFMLIGLAPYIMIMVKRYEK